MTMSLKSTKFVLIPENELEILTKIKKSKLTSYDWEILVEYWSVFKKFLNKSKLSYQLKLSEWIAKWKEHEVYIAMDTIDEIIESIDKIPEAMEKHKEEKELKKNK